MKVIAYIIVVLTIVPYQTIQQRTILDELTKFVKGTTSLVFGKTATTSGLRAARKINKLQPTISKNTPFPCQTEGGRSKIRPDSVDKLRPGDIDVIAAMGDSLTAANGAAARRYFDVSIENRGISWSIGGQGTWREFLTLPNILKEFNPNLMGYSLGDSWAYQKDAQFNVGEPVSMSRDIPYMAKVLVKRIQADKRVNVETDWKLITLMIGANDFCADICYRPNPEQMPEVHRKHLMQTLDYIRDNLPRTFVSLVIPPSIKILTDFKKVKPVCELMHMMECPCIFGRSRLSSRNRMMKIMDNWQKVVEEVSMDSRYRLQDFAVVPQPFTYKLVFPLNEKGDETDWTFLSEDCFHFSQKGYARATNAVWNNLLQPVGMKAMNWNKTFDNFLCPTENSPYLFTQGNSGPTGNRMQLIT